MNILPSQDQQEILSVIESFLSNELPVSRYRDVKPEDAVYDDAIWQQLVELGWFGIAAPAEVGGSELGLADEMLIYYEAGKQVVSTSVLATSMAVKLATTIGDNSLAETLIGGQARVAMANAATLSVDGENVSGDIQVFDASGVDYILAVTKTHVVLIDIASAGEIEALPGMDSSSTLGCASLNNVPAKVIAISENDIGKQFQVLLCALLAGVASAALDMSVEYSTEREQFGQPIGSFQALQHICADMAVLSEASHYQAVMACLSLIEVRDDADEQLASAVIMSLRAADNNTRQNIQVHGGMGFTEECNAQHYLKRRFVFEQLLKNVADANAALLAA